MTSYVRRLGRFALLCLLTAVASVVMWWESLPTPKDVVLGTDEGIAPLADEAQPKALVMVEPLEAAKRDVTLRYSGRVEPWESYTLAFETAGRIVELGQNERGRPLDEGDRVSSGQLLARLDDRVLRARLAEAVAQFEQAASDLERSRRIRDQSPGAVAESDFQNDLTQFAMRRAAQEVAEKNLEDAAIVSPVDGVIVRRMAEAGESVSPNEAVFEVIENDRLRLILSVPESRVRELEQRWRTVAQARAAAASGGATPDDEDTTFRARVRLEGKDLYGNPWPAIEAHVIRVAEQADGATGLFLVEVEVPNTDRLLRPGMVATADLVTDRVDAYAAPEASVLFRAGSAYFFTVDEVPTTRRVLFWDVGPASIRRARRIDLREWIDQGDVILVPTGGEADRAAPPTVVVTRGQQRLRDGELVRLADRPPAGASAPEVASR